MPTARKKSIINHDFWSSCNMEGYTIIPHFVHFFGNIREMEPTAFCPRGISSAQGEWYIWVEKKEGFFLIFSGEARCMLRQWWGVWHRNGIKVTNCHIFPFIYKKVIHSILNLFYGKIRSYESFFSLNSIPAPVVSFLALPKTTENAAAVQCVHPSILLIFWPKTDFWSEKRGSVWEMDRFQVGADDDEEIKFSGGQEEAHPEHNSSY